MRVGAWRTVRSWKHYQRRFSNQPVGFKDRFKLKISNYRSCAFILTISSEFHTNYNISTFTLYIWSFMSEEGCSITQLLVTGFHQRPKLNWQYQPVRIWVKIINIASKRVTYVGQDPKDFEAMALSWCKISSRGHKCFAVARSAFRPRVVTIKKSGVLQGVGSLVPLT